ncbi:hypothetical protein SUGI_0074680 [Cryptomeria japonica]|nr:hypothetical protein SUGI_0074680 [Cryptomeria japonica]
MTIDSQRDHSGLENRISRDLIAGAAIKLLLGKCFCDIISIYSRSFSSLRRTIFCRGLGHCGRSESWK